MRTWQTKRDLCRGGGLHLASSEARRRDGILRRNLHYILTAIVAVVASVALAVPSVYAATAVDTDDAAQAASASVDDGQEAAGDVGTADAGSTTAADSTETDAVNVDETVRYQATAKISDGNDVAVNVDVPAGALPDDATLEASLIGDQDTVASALDGAGVDYDGFVALDVRFVDASGNEVEPSAAVNVSFDVPQAALGDVDASSVTVQHFVEDAQGNVAKVETVADAGDTVDGTVTVDDAQAMSSDADVKSSGGMVRAEFTVDSFSTFTISYGNDTLTVHLVDQSGNDLYEGTVDFSDLSDKYDPTDFGDKYIADMWVSMADLASTWASKTEGYTYQSAYIGNISQPSVQWIRYNTSGWNRGWRYFSNTSAPADNGGNAWPTAGRHPYALYLVYTPVASTPQTGDLTIADNVAQNGTLVPKYTGNGNVDHYVWSQSADGVEWEIITRLKMNGDEYNLNEDGTEFNVVLNVVNDTADTGGRYYQVTAYDESNASLAVSPAFQLPYYDELRNGDFEAPKVADMTGNNNKGNYQYPTGTTDLIWNTTGSDQQVEIIDGTNKSSHNDYNNNGAQHGSQYAELNAEASGALYQDVMTVPGTDLNWQFSHRGRNGSGRDTMYLVIAPTVKVASITTQEQLMQFIRAVQWNPDRYPGCYVISKTDDNQSWATYSSSDSGNKSYKVPEGQYLTRFFFVAGNTASGNDTVGNLLDNVAFTTGLLPARPGTANLSITKTVSGVDSIDDLSGYKVSIALTEGSNQSCILENFLTQSNGTFVATCNIAGITVPANQSVNVTVTETVQDDTWTARGDYEATDSTVSINGGTPSSGKKGLITLTEGGATGAVAFTNSYRKNSVTISGLQETKTVEGRDAKAGEFEFTVDTSDDETDDQDDAARLAGFGDGTGADTHTYTFKNSAVSDGETDTFRSSSNNTAGGLKFTSSDVGTYTYVYKETTPGNGWHQVSSVDGANVTAWKVVIKVTNTNDLQAAVTVYQGDGTDGGWTATEMGGTYTTNSPEDANPITLTFKNTYTAVSALPLTGGDSTARTLLLTGGGVLLVAGAAWLLARRRRV